ncbi:hypothetical protein TYRP_008644 [Tyrophagus putrescentiae]|nr:hypothetical protein TYRP_008644 [Tyrophagus putrescentiae]
MLSAKLSSSTTSSGANHSGKVGGSSSIRSGMRAPPLRTPRPSPNALHTSPSNHLSSTSAFLSTGNLTRSDLYSTSRMSYILISSEHLHRGPTSISTTDPYLAEKCPFTVIKDTVYFQVSRPASLKAKVMNKAEPKYDPHGRCWSMRVEDAPVRVLNKLYDLGYKAVAESSVMGAFKQPGHAWTLFRDRLCCCPEDGSLVLASAADGPGNPFTSRQYSTNSSMITGQALSSS